MKWSNPPLVWSLLVTLAALSLTPKATCAQGSSLVGADGRIDWNRYYTSAETNQILRELHALYPEMTELYSIGESLLGAELLVMEVTNEATGPAKEKPGFYVDGNIHSGELTGSAVALYLAGYLLSRYGSNLEVTDLLDHQVFYVRPKFNPDGADLALIHDQWLRSTTRPWDEDEDGKADEDPPEDLNGDGWITMMRVPDPEGRMQADPADDRIMGQASQSVPGQRYELYREGTDNDGDGDLNEDGYGGIDMNRNFPRNWEREHLQSGSGPFPLSEPETYATVKFIYGHPNITGIVHGHTSGGFVYRLPSASNPELFPSDDLALIVHQGEYYTETTGREVRPSSTDPTRHRYGTLLTWAYWDQGIVGWVPEYSPGPEAFVTDYDGSGDIDEWEELRFNEEELGGKYFSDWEEYDHPTLGRVEIGGWHTKYWTQNPPPEFLEEECRQQVPWILYLAKQAPRLAIAGPVVEEMGNGDFKVTVTVSNEGILPTSLTGRGAVAQRSRDGEVRDWVVPTPVVSLQGEGYEVVGGADRSVIGHLRGRGGQLREVGEGDATVEWVIRLKGPRGAFRVEARSDKSGVTRTEWTRVERTR